jgi:hypothetical protein
VTSLTFTVFTEIHLLATDEDAAAVLDADGSDLHDPFRLVSHVEVYA